MTGSFRANGLGHRIEMWGCTALDRPSDPSADLVRLFECTTSGSCDTWFIQSMYGQLNGSERSSDVIARRIFDPTKRRPVAPLSEGSERCDAGENGEGIRGNRKHPPVRGFPRDLFRPTLFDRPPSGTWFVAHWNARGVEWNGALAARDTHIQLYTACGKLINNQMNHKIIPG